MSQLGSLIARGNTSDVYAWGERAVIKLLRPEFPKAWAEKEARTTAIVHDAGLPAPAVGDVVVVDGRPGVVFERIEGPVMWDRMVAEPADVGRLCRMLARLQADVTATAAPSGLPSLHARLRHNIETAAHLTPVERATAVDDLDGLPAGSALCHYDVHPANVLMAAGGPVIIDWFDAAAGDPHADVVRSSILMRHHGGSGHLGTAEAALVASLHEGYLRCVIGGGGLDPSALLRWEPVSMAGRLGEPLPATELASTYAAWQEGAAASPLRAALAEA